MVKDKKAEESSSERKLMVFVESQLKEMSPIETRSLEILEEAKALKVTDKITYETAKKIRREAITHRVETDDLRKSFTRQLDSLKGHFIKRRDVVLQPAIEAESLLKTQIDDYEREVEFVRKAEAERIQAIIDKLAVPFINRQTATIDEVTHTKAVYKAEISLIAPKDRSRKAIKEVIDAGKAQIDETLQFVTERVAQEARAAELKIEEDRIAAEREEIEKTKQDAANLEAARKVEEAKPQPIVQPADEETPVPFDTSLDNSLPPLDPDYKDIESAKEPETLPFLQFEVVDTDALPEEYWMMVPDLNHIKTDVDAGVIVPGVNVWKGGESHGNAKSE